MEDGILEAGTERKFKLKCTPVYPRPQSDFGGALNSIGSSTVPERGDLPLRLIDVNSTLKDEEGRVWFLKPEDWNFHVISHTWNQDIRNLSKKIGSTLEGKYEAASLNLDLRKEAGFLALKEFLELLSYEGVQRVWMDALCINQCDDTEKSREICRMAAFYRYSQGCYVSTHGLGQGLHLWSSVNEEQVVGWVPRWFERAWTFQELLLPRTLHFIVDGLTHSTIGILNKGIANAGKHGFCICCIRNSPGFVMKTFSDARPVVDYSATMRESYNIDFPSGNDVIMENEEHQLCSECRQPDLIRKVKMKDRADTYFVERIAYFFVVQASLGTQRLLKLPYDEYAAMDGECAKKMIEVLNMACQSDCRPKLRLISLRIQIQLSSWFLQKENMEKRGSAFQEDFIGRISETCSVAENFGSILAELTREEYRFQ